MDFEEMIFSSGDQKEQPSLPEGGIPRQKTPGWIRWPIRVLCLPFVLLDVAMQKLARLLVPPPYIKEGKCKRRGNCCYYIMIRKPEGFWGFLFQYWNTEINGFYLRDKKPYEYEGHRVIVMGCRYLQKDGSCKHYKLRPMVCRKWPVIEHFGHPRILKGCGFTAKPRNKLNILK